MNPKQAHIASALRHLPESFSRRLTAVIDSPEAERILAELETENNNEQAALVYELRQAEKVKVAAEPRLAAEAAKAAEVLKKAEHAFAEAREAYRLANLAAGGPEATFRGVQKRVHEALLGLADPRLTDFLRHLDKLRCVELVTALRYWPDEEKRKKGALHPISGNGEEVQAALDVVKAAIDGTQAVILSAHTRAEVDAFFEATCTKVAMALASLDLNPPSISTSDGEVGPPIKWQGRSQWHVDEVRDLSRADRIADANERAGKINSASKVD